MTFFLGKMSRAAPKHWAPCSLHCSTPALKKPSAAQASNQGGPVTYVLPRGDHVGLLSAPPSDWVLHTELSGATEGEREPPQPSLQGLAWLGRRREGRKGEAFEDSLFLPGESFSSLRGPPLGSDGKFTTQGTPQPHLTLGRHPISLSTSDLWTILPSKRPHPVIQVDNPFTTHRTNQ